MQQSNSSVSCRQSKEYVHRVTFNCVWNGCSNFPPGNILLLTLHIFATPSATHIFFKKMKNNAKQIILLKPFEYTKKQIICILVSQVNSPHFCSVL